jgi:hypothetical protein
MGQGTKKLIFANQTRHALDVGRYKRSRKSNSTPLILGLLAAAWSSCACSDDVSPTPSTFSIEDGGTDVLSSIADASHASNEPTSGTARPETTTPTSTTRPSTGGFTDQPVTGASTASNMSSSPRAALKARLSSPKPAAPNLHAFRAGAAATNQVDSLKYFIRSIQVCESLQPRGSAFDSAQGCLQLYTSDPNVLNIDLQGDLTPVADAARALQDGYIDLLSESSRQALTSSTVLQPEHVRTYNYGIITWALPVKVTATVTLGDGANLFTHDGVTTSEPIGNDNFRNYFTRSAVSLLQPPAEEAVVLLGNGGNWFKFQQGFDITQADLDEGRDWVLDLVFNPDGIIKGYESSYVNGNLREENDQGTPIRGITVPMIDLVPVPHREAEHVVRESYVAPVDVGDSSFDVRVELYFRENDPERTILGVDVKTLVTGATTEPPPEASKVAFVSSDEAGQLRFGSFKDAELIGNFVRLDTVGDSHAATVVCAPHSDRDGAEGGALLVLSECPSTTMNVEFTLRARARLDESIPFPTVDTDAGVEDASASNTELDGAVSLTPDASAPDDSGSPSSPTNGLDAGADDASMEDAGESDANPAP